MLMVRRVDPWCNEMAERRVPFDVRGVSLPRRRIHVHDPGEHHLAVDGAILPENPVELIVVVVDRRVSADDELPSAAREVGVSPEDAAVALVDDDRAWHVDWATAVVMHRRGQERGVGWRVVQRYRRRLTVDPHAIVTLVPRIPRAERGVAVRCHDLGDGAAVEHGTRPCTIDERDVVDFEPAPRVDADAEFPSVPRDLVA